MTDTEGPSWSDIAGWYDDLVERGSGPHETALDTLMGLVPPLVEEPVHVLDVACGTGLATRALVDAGAASVVGTDSSAAMVERARAHGGGATYVVDDAQTLATFADGSFDGVTCQLALMDIPDLDRALAAIHRVLGPAEPSRRRDPGTRRGLGGPAGERSGATRPDRPRPAPGWFAFVIAHPCFLGPGAGPVTLADGRRVVAVPEYLDERFWRSTNPEGVRRAGQHHRTLATYLNALVRAGFALEHVVEPPASARLAEQRPISTRVPIFLGARVRRA